MRYYLFDKLICPHCWHFPLTARVEEERNCPAAGTTTPPCMNYCAFHNEQIGNPSVTSPCTACLTRRIWAGQIICSACDKRYPVREGIPNLINDNVASDWVSAEQEWWEQKYAKILREKHLAALRRTTGKHGVAGHRFFERNKFLFEPFLRRGIRDKFVLEIGAGMAETVVSILPPAETHYFYIGTDVAEQALQIAARLLPEADFIQCTAGNMPFRKASFDHVLSLGVLHHIPNWQDSLERLLDLLKPDGSMLLNETIVKPRIFGRFRKQSLTAAIDSPHEGEVVFDDLARIANRKGRLVGVRFQTTPLRVVLIWITDSWTERSVLLTNLVLKLDQFFQNTFGRWFKSFGPAEVLGVIEKGSSTSASDIKG
jgi:ubiquinone/menaquinone biosynthesis C-methylase UbiE/uncharacterized protein YbaR (Trm112 family)